MHAAVKFLHTNDLGHKPTIGFRGRDHVHCVINDGASIRVIRITPRDFDLSPPLLLNDKEYPIDRIVSQFRIFGKRKSITQQASDLLAVAIAGAEIDESILDALPDDTPEARTAALSQSEPELAGNKPPSPKPAKTSAKPVPAPESRKPAKAAAKAPNAARPGLIGELAAAAGLAPPKLRALLREAGFKAPYEDRAKLEAAIKRLGGK